jgi:hypothetical protein
MTRVSVLAAVAAVLVAACCGRGRYVDLTEAPHGRAELRVPWHAYVADLHEAVQKAVGRAGADHGDCVLVVHRWNPDAPEPLHIVTEDYPYALGATAYCGFRADPFYERIARHALVVDGRGRIEPPLDEVRRRRALDPELAVVVEGYVYDDAVGAVGLLDDVVGAVGEVYFYVTDTYDDDNYLEYLENG